MSHEPCVMRHDILHRPLASLQRSSSPTKAGGSALAREFSNFAQTLTLAIGGLPMSLSMIDREYRSDPDLGIVSPVPAWNFRREVLRVGILGIGERKGERVSVTRC